MEYERNLISKKIKIKAKQPNKIQEVILTLKPSPLEFLCPLELTENKSIIFRINGKVKNENNETNEIYNTFPLGQLLGRNSSVGDEGYFQIYNGLKYTPKKSGGLFLKFNYDIYNKYELKGECILTISLATQMNNIDLIYRHLGFGNVNDGSERELFFYINLFREYPLQFCNVYLKDLEKYKKKAKECINEIENIKEPLYKFEKNNFLSKLSEELCDDLVTHNKFSHFDSQGRNLKQRAKDLYYSSPTRKSNDIKETFTDIKESLIILSSLYINNDSCNVTLVIQLLMDELLPSKSNRHNLINPNLKYIGYRCKNNENLGCICVLIFSEKPYSNYNN